MQVWEKKMGPIRTPEDSPRLFDMVRVKDEAVRAAFYFALRDTLVANDMEQATRMAFQKDRRWRVVTLKGQIIEMAGGCFQGLTWSSSSFSPAPAAESHDTFASPPLIFSHRRDDDGRRESDEGQNGLLAHYRDLTGRGECAAHTHKLRFQEQMKLFFCCDI